MALRRWWAGVAIATVTLWLAASPLTAQQAQEGFVKMSPEDMARETIPAAPLVFIAYAIVWVGVVIYVFTLWRRLSRVERDLADVSARLRGR